MAVVFISRPTRIVLSCLWEEVAKLSCFLAYFLSMAAVEGTDEDDRAIVVERHSYNGTTNEFYEGAPA